MTKLNLTSLPTLSMDRIQRGRKCQSLGKSEWEETCFLMTSLLQYTSYRVLACRLQQTGDLSGKDVCQHTALKQHSQGR